ncbi:MAG TPA: anti-sigma factor [Xanthobacteraceae bacterium]|jgi:anti-sigma factor RsiW|nr:anti-sigma factor [Xanthobacteraceae bacterium]
MNCAESEVLIHALIDGELDAGHAREVEAHVATCRGCADKLGAFRAMRAAITAAELKEKAPTHLRRRVEAALTSPPTEAAGAAGRLGAWLTIARASRRNFLGGFALGTAVSAAVAASVVITVLGAGEDRRIAGEIVSAHLRSLQGSHLTDVETSDQHTVKPWFNGKLALSPPVVDLTAQGFTLIGGRLDYVDGEAMAAIVYKRRKHLINLFVGPRLGGAPRGAKTAMVQGFNVYHWAQDGLGFWAASDINADELAEFGRHIADTKRPPSARP